MPAGIKGFEALDELTSFLCGFDGVFSFIAGGTDQVIRLNQGLVQGLLVDISRIKELSYIRGRDDRVYVGAGTTFRDIAASPVILEKAACLADASATMGSPQIRSRATIGGNIASASPAADSLPPLTALEARATILNFLPGGVVKDERVIDACGQQLGPRELILDVNFPAYGPEWCSGFAKIGSRSQVSISKLSLALSVQKGPAGVIASGRAAMGALGEIPICPDDLNQFFSGRPIDRHLPGDLADALSAIVQNVIPDRESMPYKSSAVRALAYDLAAKLFPETVKESAI